MTMRIRTMHSRSHQTAATALALLLAGVASAGFATADELPNRALTYSGSVAELEEISEGQPSLAVVRGDESMLVPTTGDSKLETPLGLISSRSGRLTALWMSWEDSEATLSFATLEGEQWDGPYSLGGGAQPISFGTEPFVTVGQQRVSLSFDDETSVELERHVAHVVWTDETDRVRYSPLIFNEGTYVGWNEIVTLSSAFRTAHEDTSAPDQPVSLSPLVAIQADGDPGLKVTLADREFGRVGTIQIRTVPLALEILGQSIFDHVLDAADLLDPSDASALSDEVRGHIIHSGSRLNLDPTVAGFLSERVGDWMLENGPGFGWDLFGLAAAVQASSLDVSQAVYRITVPSGSGTEGITLLDIGDFLDGNGHREELSNLVNLQITADFAVPASASDGSIAHVSEDGSALAFSWQDGDGNLKWIENRGSGWSDEKALSLSDALNASSARQLIDASIR